MEQFKPLNSDREPEPKLQYGLYILYLIQFENQLVESLINLDTKVNVINVDLVKKLGLLIRKIKVDAQNINSSKLNTFGR